MTAPLRLLADDPGVNAAMVDAWTPLHALSGLVAGVAGVPFAWAAGGAVLYEVVEYAHEWPRGSVLFGSKRPESIANVAVDVAVFLATWWVGARLR